MTGVSPELIQELRRAVASLEGGAVVRPGEASSAACLGAEGLGSALWRLGYGEGRLVEVVGPRSCGKRSLIMRWMAERSRAGSVVAWVDGVGGLEAPACERVGFVLSRLLVVRPGELEQDLFFVLSTLARCSAIAWVVADVGDAPRPRWSSGALSRLSVFARHGGTPVWLLRDAASRGDAWWEGAASLRLRVGRPQVELHEDGWRGGRRLGRWEASWAVERSRPVLPSRRYEEGVHGDEACGLYLAGGAADPGVSV